MNKVLHIPICYHPDNVGGVEIYVESLCRCLKLKGITSLIAVLGRKDEKYEYQGTTVYRCEASSALDVEDLYGRGDEVAVQSICRLLDVEKPDLVHLHTLSSFSSARLVTELKKRKIPVIYTVHVANFVCQRGNLWYWGEKLCDGILRHSGCAKCVLQGRGLSKWLVFLIGSLPVSFARLIKRMGLRGGMWTALKMNGLMERREKAFHELMSAIDLIVIPAKWLHPVLIRNRIPEKKIVFCPQGVPIPNDGDRPVLEKFVGRDHKPLRIVFVGRLHASKGLHLLMEALGAEKTIEAELHIFGIMGNNDAYRHRIERLLKEDSRIFFHGELHRKCFFMTLRNFDIMAIPSQPMEVAPLVVMEAYAAGLPVMASSIGGLTEMVEHGINGLLLPHDSVAAWRQTILQLSKDWELLKRLRQGVRMPRTMSDVAGDMSELYRKILDHCGAK